MPEWNGFGVHEQKMQLQFDTTRGIHEVHLMSSWRSTEKMLDWLGNSAQTLQNRPIRCFHRGVTPSRRPGRESYWMELVSDVLVRPKSVQWFKTDVFFHFDLADVMSPHCVLAAALKHLSQSFEAEREVDFPKQHKRLADVSWWGAALG